MKTITPSSTRVITTYGGSVSRRGGRGSVLSRCNTTTTTTTTTTRMMAANSNSAFTLANNQSGGGHSSRRWGRVVRRNLSTEVIMDKRGDRGTEKDNNNDERRSAVSSELKLNIQGRHLKVTESLRQYVEDQVTRAVSHFMHHHHDINKGRNSPISRTDVRLSTRGGPKHSTKGPQLQKAEVTVFTTIGVVRAEVETDHAYNSIDEACKTVERKLRKLKE